MNGLRMYYEIHGSGTGTPLVLLHGGLCTIEACFSSVLPSLAKTRRVIAIEQQAHGHTADIDRPLSYEQMAEDTVALLAHLGIGQADFFGYSVGGATGLRIAMRHPSLVRRLVFLAASYDKEGWDPAVLKGIAELTPEAVPQAFQEAYAKVAPDPKQWPTLVGKVKRLALDFKGWRAEDVRSIKAPVLIMPEIATSFAPSTRCRCSGCLLHAQLAVLPGSDHFAIFTHPDWVLSMSRSFLDSQEIK